MTDTDPFVTGAQRGIRGIPDDSVARLSGKEVRAEERERGASLDLAAERAAMAAVPVEEPLAEDGVVGARPDECICTNDNWHIGCPVVGHGWGSTRQGLAQIARESGSWRGQARAAVAALAASDRELAALSTDKQTLMTAVTHWRERAEAAEDALETIHIQATGIGYEVAHKYFAGERGG